MEWCGQLLMVLNWKQKVHGDKHPGSALNVMLGTFIIWICYHRKLVGSTINIHTISMTVTDEPSKCILSVQDLLT